VTQTQVHVELPGGWQHVATLPIGGLSEVGFDAGERYLLVVSPSGRGLVDTSTGKRIARDHEVPTATATWIDRRARTVAAIGPLAGTKVPCVGLWGGTLSHRADQWAVEIGARGLREFVFLRDLPLQQRYELTEAIAEIRAYGFSNTGDIMIVATASEVSLWRRILP
jgi:hypothetical protein